MRHFLASTRGRLTLIHAIVLASAIVIADAVVYVTLERVQRGAADDSLRAAAGSIAASVGEDNGRVAFRSGTPGETQQGIAIDAAIVSRNGSIVQTGSQPLSPAALSEVAATVNGTGTPMFESVPDIRGAPRRVYAGPLHHGEEAGVLVVSRSVSEIDSALGGTTTALAVFSLLVVVVGTALAYWLAGRVLHPVRRIAALARTLSQHDLHRRIDFAVPSDELGELVETLNGMLTRLESGFESMRRFTASASHELRTPLAVMRSELELAESRPRTRAEHARLVEALKAEVQHMSRTTDQLLLLARSDAGALKPAKQPVDVADMLHETASRWTTLAEPKRLQLEVRAPESGTLNADPGLVRRALDNLIDNAVRHSPTRGLIGLAAIQRNGAWDIEVSDQGPGVLPEARPLLFQPFARPDRARSRSDGGAGLGLAVSRAVAQAHGGEMRLVERPRAGAVFVLRLPIDDAA